MKPHRTPLLPNAVTGSVRSPAQGPAVSAPAYTAHTHSPAAPADHSDTRLTKPRQATALRERLSQTRARIARAHAERPPQIDVDWDAEEPPTRLYQGEKLPLPRAARAPSGLTQQARPTYADRPRASAQRARSQKLDQPSEQSLESAWTGSLAQTTYSAASDHGGEPWYTDLDAQPTPSDDVRDVRHPPSAQFPHTQSFTGMPYAPATGGNQAEQALTARVSVPVAARAAGLDRPSAGHSLTERESWLPSHPSTLHAPLLDLAVSARVRAARACKEAANALRAHLAQLSARIDRSDATLRKRVAYGSLALLVIAAISRMMFGGAASGAGASETSQHSATAPSTPVLQPASVSIDSDPPGALVSLDGQVTNQLTPVKLSDLPPGRHTLSLKLAGYAETKEALNLPADALVSIKLASLSEPRFAPEPIEPKTSVSRAEQRAQARELARERRAAARAAKVLLRYRARMGLPPDPVAQELVEAYGPAASAE